MSVQYLLGPEGELGGDGGSNPFADFPFFDVSLLGEDYYNLLQQDIDRMDSREDALDVANELILRQAGYAGTTSEIFAQAQQDGWTFSQYQPIQPPAGGVPSGPSTPTEPTGSTEDFADSGGNPTNPPVEEEEPGIFDNILGGIVDLLDGLFGGSDGAVSISIPGFPVSIPGNASFEDLLDIAVGVATNTGQAVQDVLDQILGGLEAAGEQVPDPGTGEPGTPDPGPFPDPGTGETPGPGTPTTPQQPDPAPNDEQSDAAFCGLGRPWGLAGYDWEERCGMTHNSDGSLKGDDLNEDPQEPQVPGIDGDIEQPDPTVPGVDGDLNEDPTDPTVPGVTGDIEDETEDETPGLDAIGGALAGLIPFALRADRPERELLTPGRQLMQARESRLTDRPDYGTPTPQGLFDFGTRISQPIQVAQDPEARRETMSATERERLRRMRRQGLLG